MFDSPHLFYGRKTIVGDGELGIVRRRPSLSQGGGAIRARRNRRAAGTLQGGYAAHMIEVRMRGQYEANVCRVESKRCNASVDQGRRLRQGTIDQNQAFTRPDDDRG
jgi:hypothetical protein